MLVFLTVSQITGWHAIYCSRAYKQFWLDTLQKHQWRMITAGFKTVFVMRTV